MQWQGGSPVLVYRLRASCFIEKFVPVFKVQYIRQCLYCYQKRIFLTCRKQKQQVNGGYLTGIGLGLPQVAPVKQVVRCTQQNGKGPLSGKAWWSGLLTGTVLFALLIPYIANLTGNSVVLTEDEVNFKLRQIPVFAVTDGEGKPFLLESPMNSNNQRDGYFFIDKDDAVSFKDLVTSQDSAVTTKIFPITLDIAERFIQGKMDPTYVSSSDKFHLASNVEDLEFADKILKAEFDRTDVPIFAVEKLRLEVQIPLDQDEQQGAVSEQPQIKRITPLFLKKQDLESLLSVAKKNSENSFEPMIRVYKLSELLASLKRGEFGSLDDFIFYPPEESLEYIRKLSSS